MSQQITELIKMMEEEKKVPPPSSTRVITVVSGKGGVGKSNISTNLAFLYGKSGKKVLIMDADMGLANINVLLNLIPRHTIFDVVQNNKNLNEIIISYNKNIDLIPGATGFYQLTEMTSEKQEKLVDQLFTIPHYDIIIIDVGAGISQHVISFVNAADDVLLVTTPEPTALTDAYGVLKTVVSKTNTREAGLIVNMVENELQASQVYQKLSSVASKFLAFKLSHLGYLQDDINIKKAVQMQELFVNKFPNIPPSNSMRAILAKLEKTDDIAKKESSIHFFKKMFNFSKSN